MIDSHCHLADDAFTKDLPEVLERAQAAGLTSRSLESVKSETSLGSFAVLATENVGPQVGSELRKRGFLAVIGARNERGQRP